MFGRFLLSCMCVPGKVSAFTWIAYWLSLHTWSPGLSTSSGCRGLQRKMRLLRRKQQLEGHVHSQSVNYACSERIVFPRWVVSWKVVAKLRESLLQRAKRGGLWWWQLPTRICSSSSGRKAALRLQWRYAAAPVAALLLRSSEPREQMVTTNKAQKHPPL